MVLSEKLFISNPGKKGGDILDILSTRGRTGGDILDILSNTGGTGGDIWVFV